MKRTLSTGVAVSILALSLGLSACGSDDSGDKPADGQQPAEATLSKSELISQADQICADVNKTLRKKQEDMAAEYEDRGDDMSQEEVLDVLSDFASNDMVPLYQDEVAQLRQLNPGPAVEPRFTEMLDTLEAEIQNVADDPRSMAEDAMSGNQGVAFPKAKKLAGEIGFKVCGAQGEG